MAPRLSGQNSIFGVVFFVSKSLLGIERQKKLEKFAILTRKPRSHARILIYRTWPIRIYTIHEWYLKILSNCAHLKACVMWGEFSSNENTRVFHRDLQTQRRGNTVSSVDYLLNRNKNYGENRPVKSSKSMLIKTGYPNLPHGLDYFHCFT